MPTVKVIKPFKRRGEIIPPDSIIEIPADIFQKLTDFVCLVPDGGRDNPVKEPPPRIWIENGELRSTGVFSDLASEIVKLTGNDLELQRRLLISHCQAYAPTHLWSLAEKWNERAAILEYDAGMNRQQAEEEAAKQYNLIAFLADMRRIME